MLKQLLILSAISLSAFSGTASAIDLAINKYASLKNSTEFQFYIVGAESGLSYANLEHFKAGRPMLFCVPLKKVISKEEVFEMTEAGVQSLLSDPGYVRADAQLKAKYTVTEALIRELTRRYPCKDGGK